LGKDDPGKPIKINQIRRIQLVSVLLWTWDAESSGDTKCLNERFEKG
jgi:hypothetical protein